MSTKAFMKHQKAIDYQMMNLGLPTNNELKNNDDVVYVHEYLRGDGTVVKAHYRSKPDGIEANNYGYNKDKITAGEALIYGASRLAQRALPLADANLQDGLRDFIRAKKDNNAHIINSRSEISDKGLNKLMDEIGIPKTSKGVIYDSDSRFSKQLWHSKEIQEFYKNNFGKLLNKKENYSEEIEFKKGFRRLEQMDNHLAIQHCKIYNPHITNDGYFNGIIVDLYDFMYRDKSTPFDVAIDLNNWGYSMQKKGYLQNYFVMYFIHEKIY